ncbi:hypothetical protein GCM10007304_18670 [Rhodococcoides trifolii]|uniref:Pyridoxamine 5-phosphate oxidase n=1 Tax=Rhodococcoides trifolii TaxID=908250 RepID=A0A917CZW9_9NOCA|nr:DUF1697 domain-containing protein [Rhodococcus trifolii]GGG04871.1 hypothetical protein GCM10007304_18670 [Rhodococcus trifolii]
MRFVVLLRGVNVGGINIKMADLRAALAPSEFRGVRTVLASGNVVVDTDESDPGVVKAKIERVLSDTFGYTAWVIVLDVPTLESVVADFPYDAADAARHPYVVFSSDGVSTTELSELADTLDPGVEQCVLGEHHVLYWQVIKGNTLDSVIGKASARARYKSTTTTRNLRTLQKILA